MMPVVVEVEERPEPGPTRAQRGMEVCAQMVRKSPKGMVGLIGWLAGWWFGGLAVWLIEEVSAGLEGRERLEEP